MTRKACWLAGLVVALVGAGCGDDGGSGTSEGSGGAATGPGATTGTGTAAGSGGAGTTGASGSGGSATSGTGGGTGTGGGAATWTPLITADWELDTGEEITSAIFSIKPDRDIFVGGIRPIAPVGTHHTVLARDSFTAGNYIYASGVGTNELMFPEGVGLKIAAGEDVVLQLHVFNPTPGPLSGTSGIEIVELSADEVQEEAEIFLPGPFDLQIPAQQEHSQSSVCTITAPQKVFALFPHMHQLGTHFKTTLTVGGQPSVLHDEPYEFDHQPFLSFEPIDLAPGDTIQTECTWVNTTNQDVSWGESSTSEMCFSIMYRWPLQDDTGFCF